MDNVNPAKVLIVDDSETNRLLLRFMLEELKFDCDEADNGEQGVELALEFDYVAVFMDLNMPVMSGQEATEILRNINFEKPIFACSAEDNSEKIDLLLKSGFNDFVAKPIEPKDIRDILSKHGVNNTLLPSADYDAYQKKLDQLGNRFIDNLPVMINKIERSLNNNSVAELKRIAHKLKGTASQFGFENIAAVGRDIESAINKNKFPVALEKAEFLLTELKRLKSQKVI